MKEKKDEKNEESGKDKKAKTKVGKFVIIGFVLLAIIAGAFAGYDYYKLLESRVYIEKSMITAPIISLTPSASGVLERLLVREGDTVKKDMIIAKIGSTSIKAKSDGVIISVNNLPGQLFTSQTYIAKMIDPNEFRVVGRLDEDKGLEYIKVSQRVIFTVDAFGDKKYEGIVDSIAPSSRDSDVVFSISDKREQKQFEVKAKFNIESYPELKNGMSVRMWVYK
jgi:multidrug resistance efflux pump